MQFMQIKKKIHFKMRNYRARNGTAVLTLRRFLRYFMAWIIDYLG